MDYLDQMRRFFEPDGTPRMQEPEPRAWPLNFGDGHRYDYLWDDKGRRWVCIHCGAQLFRDRIACTRL